MDCFNVFIFVFNVLFHFWINDIRCIIANSIAITEDYKEIPSSHLPVQRQQQKHEKKVWNMFKVNNKNNRMTPMTSL